MFFYTTNLISISFINFEDNNMTDLGSMFKSCFSLISVDFSNFKVENVENMEDFFMF